MLLLPGSASCRRLSQYTTIRRANGKQHLYDNLQIDRRGAARNKGGRAECTAESRAKKKNPQHSHRGNGRSRWPRLNPSLDLNPRRTKKNSRFLPDAESCIKDKAKTTDLKASHSLARACVGLKRFVTPCTHGPHKAVKHTTVTDAWTKWWRGSQKRSLKYDPVLEVILFFFFLPIYKSEKPPVVKQLFLWKILLGGGEEKKKKKVIKHFGLQTIKLSKQSQMCASLHFVREPHVSSAPPQKNWGGVARWHLAKQYVRVLNPVCADTITNETPFICERDLCFKTRS